MFLRHSRRSVPELNTTSTADISFILLVFFLVITSMDVDKGLSRRLSPIDAKPTTEASEVSKSNVLSLQLTAKSRLIANGKPLDTALLRRCVIRFVGSQADRQRHVITLDVDRNATYDSYFAIQNEITAAYNTLREQYAKKTFGRPYKACTPEERDKARDYYPQHLVESTSEQQKGGAQ